MNEHEIQTGLTKQMPSSARDPAISYSLSDLFRLLGAAEKVDAASDAFPLAVRHLRAEAALFHQGASADSIGFVRSGAFKCLRTGVDGYELVVSFPGRGDLMGFDALHSEKHPTAAVALEDSSVMTVQRRDLPRLLELVP